MKLWPEALNYSAFLEILIFKVDGDKPAMETWNGDILKNCFNCLVQFVRIGYVANKDNIKGKMIERGFPAIMVGYAANLATGTYIMYKPATKEVILTHDIKWHGFYGENTENHQTLPELNEGTGQKKLLGRMQETRNK